MFLRWRLSGMLCLAALALLVHPVQAQDSLKLEIAELAKSLSQSIAELGEDSVAVGQFSGPPQFPSTGGPGIANNISEELSKLGVRVTRIARLGIKGEYRNVKDQRSGKLAARIEAVLSERNGRERLQLVRLVFGTEALTSLFGLTADLPADQDSTARDEKLQASLEQPSIHIAGARVATRPDSPFAVEVLVKSSDAYQSRPAVGQEGLAFVKLSRGELYALRLVNNSPHDAGVEINIDGLNLFAFSEFKYRNLFVPAGQASIVHGWHRTNEISDTFQVMEYSKSEAGKRLAPSSADGTITVTFAAAWPENAAAPSDEPATQGARSVDGTGRGPGIDAAYREERRHVGVVRAAISVRYTESVVPASPPKNAPPRLDQTPSIPQ